MKKQLLTLSVALFAAFGYSQTNSPTWPASGNVGIGTTSPTVKLDVVGGSGLFGGPTKLAYFGGRNSSTGVNTNGIFLGSKEFAVGAPLAQLFYRSSIFSVLGATYTGFIDFGRPATANTTSASLSFGYGSTEYMRVNQDGKVRIGLDTNDIKTPDGYKLFVEDGILTEKVKVAVKTTSDWADYVFASDYKRMTLDEVAAFTKANKHLPNVPSAEEIVNCGLDVAKMDAKLLEKIEELTLYIIDQDDNAKQLKAELSEQKKETECQKKEIEELKAQMKLLMAKQ